MADCRLVLASRSPQRVNLLRVAGFAFDIDPADIDEEAYPRDLTPEKVAEHLSAAKATHVAGRRGGAIVIGADTVVVGPDAALLGKPADASAARQMLHSLGGSTHNVITGYAIVGRGIYDIGHVVSRVRMRPLSPGEIETYVASNQWQGKAGGYGIQDDDPFVEAIEGPVSNVIGLPIEIIQSKLIAMGMKAKSPVGGLT